MTSTPSSEKGSPADIAPRSASWGWLSGLGRSREWTVAYALLALLLFLAIKAPDFYQPQPLLSLLTRESPSLVVACGMALVMICRQIDISVGSQFGVCSVVAGLLAAQGMPLVGVVAGAMASGAILGALNGWLVSGLRLPSIVVTLATMVTWREALRWLRQGQFVTLPDGSQWMGASQFTGQCAIIGFGLTLLICLAWGSRRLGVGRRIYAVGSDAEASRLAGMKPGQVTFQTFVLMGALTGFAAWMSLIQSPQVDPKSGSRLEMKAIAAAVVGGVAVSGGRGSLWGVGLGWMLLSAISPALTHLHVQAHWEKALQGLIILMAVIADGWRSRKR